MSKEPVEDAGGETMSAFERRLTSLLALLLTEGRLPAEQVSLLSRAGYRPTEIADLLGTTANAVSVMRYKSRRAGKR